MSSPRQMTLSSFVAFAAFGAFWGVWGAAVPRVQDQAGITDGQLGFALLFIGFGALPAMLLAGRALDRWGLRVTAWVVAGLGWAGVGMTLTATDLTTLCVGLALVGAISGAADVAINAVAGRAERVADRPVITLAHGVFSSFVVLGSLATGLAASLPLAVPFIAVAVFSLAAGASMVRTLPAGVTASTHEEHDPAPPGRWRVAPFVLVGALGALAFASENAHQSWSAVYANDVLRSGLGRSAIAPAIFAATVAITRFSVGGFKAVNARTVLLVGSLAAATGTTVIAIAPTLLIAALGLAVAAAGTAVLFPTIVGVVSRNVHESRRGRATSVVTTVSYLGYILGPVYVGLWADTVGLRGAMIAVAALAVILFVLAPAVLRLSGLAVAERLTRSASSRTTPPAASSFERP